MRPERAEREKSTRIHGKDRDAERIARRAKKGEEGRKKKEDRRLQERRIIQERRAQRVKS